MNVTHIGYWRSQCDAVYDDLSLIPLYNILQTADQRWCGKMMEIEAKVYIIHVFRYMK